MSATNKASESARIVPDEGNSISHVRTTGESSNSTAGNVVTYNRIRGSTTLSPADEAQSNDNVIESTKAGPITFKLNMSIEGDLTNDEIMRKIDQWMATAPKSAVEYNVAITRPDPKALDNESQENAGTDEVRSSLS